MLSLPRSHIFGLTSDYHDSFLIYILIHSLRHKKSQAKAADLQFLCFYHQGLSKITMSTEKKNRNYYAKIKLVAAIAILGNSSH